MDWHAKQTPKKTAIVFEEQTINWAELAVQVDRAAGFFTKRLKDDRQRVVAILLTNSPQFVIAYLGILKAGHIALPLDPAYKKMELDAIIGQVPPELIITDGRYWGQISDYPDQKIKYEEILNNATSRKFLRLNAKYQIASLTFTSGTTGKAKAVPNTHANHIWNIKVCSEVWEWTSDDTMLLNLPLSHMHGIVMGLSGIIYHGNTVYLRQQSFNTNEMLNELASGRISIFSHGPLAYMKMLEEGPPELDLSAVRLMISGSGPLPPAASDEFQQRFGVRIIETYGSTETGRIAANRLAERRTGTPGKPLPGVRIKLTREGEIMVKSGGLFPGYYQNEQATKEGFKSGWWRTGDIGEIKDGFIYLKGRRQEQIRKFGYSVSPRDVEWAMLQNPQIKAIYVMGRQQPNKPNDEIIYFVISDLSDKEIIDYGKTNLLFAWRPDKIIHLKSLPRATTGKLKLAKLRELAGVSNA